jgi:pyruvate-formate lyase
LTNLSDEIYAQNLKRPFSSVLVDGGLEKGEDCSENFYREGLALLNAGCTNIANSLAAINRLVFDDKAVSMEDLITALKKNWEGYEKLRQAALNAPKYGNDNDYVDRFMKWVHVETNKIFMKHRGNHGGMYTLGSSIASGYYAVSMTAWATPDGRRYLDPGADATASPTAGSDTRGPTAVINSVSKINVLDSGWDQLLNAKFHPTMLAENRAAIKAYIKSWGQKPNWHVQFNVVDKETLLDAQEHPEKHQDLVVRVAGYSAFFVDLSGAVQDDIIKRAELMID